VRILVIEDEVKLATHLSRALETEGHEARVVHDGKVALVEARGYKVQGQQRVDLSWNGASSNNIDVYRNGVLITTVPNIPGFYTDNIGARGRGTYTYWVCDPGTQHCSNQVTVKFGGNG
jgi:hypothetical protein